MKQMIALTLCVVLLLTGCGKKPVASVPSVESQNTKDAASSTAQSQSRSSAASAVASSTPTQQATKQQTVTLSVSNEDKLALLVFKTPDAWNHDGGTTFSRDEKKAMEIAAIWKVEDATNPLHADLVYGFGASDEMHYPNGLGHIQTLDKLVADNICRTYYYKMWPDDAENPWYPHYMFYVVEGYVVQIYFFSDSQTDEDALFDEVLSSLSLHFAA